MLLSTDQLRLLIIPYLECTRRKVKCDKQVPCSRCRRAGLGCTRERVLVSNIVTKHGGELKFLKELETRLLAPRTTVNDLAHEICKRINTLEAGDPGRSDESLARSPPQDDQAPGRPLPTENLVNEPFRTADKVPGYAATVTLESLAWGRHYGGCYPHRRCDCHRHRSPSEMISIRSDLSAPLPSPVPTSRVTLLTSNVGPLPSLPDSIKLVKFHLSHMAWHHGILHTPTFLEQCEVFWNTNSCQHPLWMALYLSVLSVS